jgi:predicted dehydrogenase
MSQLRIGLLGCGQIALKVHLPVLAGLPGVKVAALADIDAARLALAARLAPGASTYADYCDLLGGAPLEAVIICLPPALHRPAAVAAFEAGRHVYHEKPLAASLEDGRAIVDSWRRSGRVGMIGFNYRFHPLVRELRQTLQAHRLGQPIGMQTVFATPGPPRSNWRSQPGSGGALLDLASHHIDLVRWLLGDEITQVFACLRSTHSEHDSAALALRLAGGLDVQLLAAYGSLDEDRFEVYGPNGKLRLDRYRGLEVQFTNPLARFGALRRAARALALPARLPYWLERRRAPANEPSYRTALACFVEAARTGRPAAPDLLDGYRSLAVVAAAEQSARTGQLAAPADLDVTRPTP